MVTLSFLQIFFSIFIFKPILKREILIVFIIFIELGDSKKSATIEA